MSKKVHKVVVEVEDQVVADKIVELFATYRSQFIDFVHGGLRSAGVPSDPYMHIPKEGHKIVVQTVAKDKGVVWALNEKNVPAFMEYKDVKVGERYCLLDRGLAMFKKNDDKTPDVRYGQFNTVTDMYREMATIEVPEEEPEAVMNVEE